MFWEHAFKKNELLNAGKPLGFTKVRDFEKSELGEQHLKCCAQRSENIHLFTSPFVFVFRVPIIQQEFFLREWQRVNKKI